MPEGLQVVDFIGRGEGRSGFGRFFGLFGPLGFGDSVIVGRDDPILNEPSSGPEEVDTVNVLFGSFAVFGGLAGEVVCRFVGIGVVITDAAVEDLLLSEVGGHLAEGGGGEASSLVKGLPESVPELAVGSARSG